MPQVVVVDTRWEDVLNRMPCGLEMQLQVMLPTQSIRLRSRLIGIDPGKAVIVQLGMDRNWINAKSFLNEGQGAVVRLFNNDEEGHVLAFRSSITKVITLVGRWLVLAYPKKVEQIALRGRARLAINLPADLLYESKQGQMVTGALTDLSLTGCGIEVAEIPPLQAKDKVIIRVMSDDGSPLTINGQVRSLAQEGQARLGIQFNGDAEELEPLVQKLLVQALSARLA